MSDEAAGSSQEFSLPTVGGGLHDIGEKLPRDLTVDGSFTVSVALPDGLSGFQPQLNLVYVSGTFGAGWNLNIPGVNRQTYQGTTRWTQHGFSTGCFASLLTTRAPLLFTEYIAEDGRNVNTGLATVVAGRSSHWAATIVS